MPVKEGEWRYDNDTGKSGGSLRVASEACGTTWRRMFGVSKISIAR